MGEDRLSGRAALVTGGGRGLGAAICELLGESGARIAVADLNADAAGELAERLVQREIEAFPLALDVGDETQVAAAVETVCARFGGIDIVVNNAGTDVTKPIGELGGDEWQRVVSTNLTGPFLMTKHAVASMLAARSDGRTVRGHVVNIASTASKRAWPNASAYHASKWGLLGMSHALHAELRPLGIKVSAIVAGGMRTPFLLDRFPDIDPGVLQDPVHVARAVRYVLMQDEETVIPELMVVPMRESSWP
ncbi:MAG: SDR family oxidoreductase [Limnobacter sp.]|nr:SDR family oxidoreductase [Limnobacter sp.]